jgi:hypothetical protein
MEALVEKLRLKLASLFSVYISKSGAIRFLLIWNTKIKSYVPYTKTTRDEYLNNFVLQHQINESTRLSEKHYLPPVNVLDVHIMKTTINTPLLY